jgi:hypothetical protein
MAISEAQKRATQKYVRKVLAGLESEMGSFEHARAANFMEKRREYARRAMKKAYDQKPDVRDKIIARVKSAYYYDNSDGKYLLAVRRLFV